VIIDPNGKVAQIYGGNDWKPQEVVEQIKKQSASSAVKAP